MDAILPPRARSARTASQWVLMWKYRVIWGMPLAGEVTLLVAAASLSLCLGKAMKGNVHGAEWLWLFGAVTLFFCTRAIGDACDLFMPRFVSFVGVGFLCLAGMALMLGAVAPVPWNEVFVDLGLKNRSLAVLPLGLFVFRGVSVIHSSRFSPALDEMNLCTRKMSDGVLERIKRQLDFWLR